MNISKINLHKVTLRQNCTSLVSEEKSSSINDNDDVKKVEITREWHSETSTYSYWLTSKNYPMNVFKLPVSFCDEIRKLVSQFWWGQKQGERKTHWLAWRSLCRAKSMGGLGFRDYELFNSAMLGKQVWRLCVGNATLATRVLSGKYYPNSSFLDSTLGSNPSYTWRSIWEAKGVLLKGLRKKIGDGKSTLVWFDSWIPSSQTGRVITSRREGVNIEWVSDLIGADGRWDVDLINETFLPFEAERILQIRLSARRPVDEWFWAWEKSGEYSVRSAYHSLFEDGVDEASTTSDKNLWKSVWTTPALPRVKHMFWQWCREALPTRARLRDRLNITDGSCPLCMTRTESDLHLFRDCGRVFEIWEKVELEEVVAAGGSTVAQWLEAVWSMLRVRDRSRFMIVMWAIWRARNDLVFEGAAFQAPAVAERVTSYVLELEDVLGKRGKSEREVDAEEWRWKAPGIGTVKLNVDAGIFSGDGVGYGGIARGENGEVLWCFAIQEEREEEVRLAEAYAVLYGLEMALERENLKISKP